MVTNGTLRGAFYNAMNGKVGSTPAHGLVAYHGKY